MTNSYQIPQPLLPKEEIKIELIDGEPSFLRGQEKRITDRFADTQMNRSIANMRTDVEKMQSRLGDVLARVRRNKPPIFEEGRELSRTKEGWLPISDFRNSICHTVSENRTVIVVGETGSGKTTQIPQYLVEAKFFSRGGRVVGCSLPHREAAKDAAERVPDKLIRYMDQHTLCNEIVADRYLASYSAIMIDDAHERSIIRDVLFGLIKNVVFKNRVGFRLIVSLATEDEAQRLAIYFYDGKIIALPSQGTNIPVKIASLIVPRIDRLKRALDIVLAIRAKKATGDIVLFLPGETDVDYGCQYLSSQAERPIPDLRRLISIPVCSSLRRAMDPRLFEKTPLHAIKVVVATGVAEAMLTPIEGVHYVVDLCLNEQCFIDTRQAVDWVANAWISTASMERRAALAGRTRSSDNESQRLYTKVGFHGKMNAFPVPEILTANLGTAILQILASGTNDVSGFEYLHRPPPRSIVAALRQLYFLHGLDEKGMLTDRGREMALFPLEPPWSKALIYGISVGFGEEVLTIVSMAQVGCSFSWPKEIQAEEDRRLNRQFLADGDHLSLLRVFEEWLLRAFSPQWCEASFVDVHSFRRAMNLRNHLAAILDRHNVKIESSGANVTAIKMAIVSGLFFHAARRDSQEECYRTLVGNANVYIHSQSVLVHQQPSWVVYNKLVKEKNRESMFGVMAIDPNWLIELAPRFYRRKE